MVMNKFSDVEAREKLAVYAYEYMIHMGATNTAKQFLNHINKLDYGSNFAVENSPGFLHSWWSIYCDIYSATPERRDVNSTSEAKAYYDIILGTHPPDNKPKTTPSRSSHQDYMQPIPNHMFPNPSSVRPAGMYNDNHRMPNPYHIRGFGPSPRFQQEHKPPYMMPHGGYEHPYPTQMERMPIDQSVYNLSSEHDETFMNSNQVKPKRRVLSDESLRVLNMEFPDLGGNDGFDNELDILNTSNSGIINNESMNNSYSEDRSLRGPYQ